MPFLVPKNASIPPAHQLLDVQLDNDWRVTEKIKRPLSATGGFFSVQYIVENSSGKKAFLKAIDFSKASVFGGNFADQIKELADAFIFERDLLYKCKERKMTRIVTAIDSGEVQSTFLSVPYLIFEMATGDVRAYSALTGSFEAAWACRALHHVSVGLSQLHRSLITHQDLKPSNVLTYEQGSQSRIADLGRATDQAMPASHDQLLIAGDLTYAPPELLYGTSLPNELERRFATDMYHLGSLAVFFFSGGVLTSMIEAQLAPTQKRGQWYGTYSELLPFVIDAFETIMTQVKASIYLDTTLDDRYKADLITNIRELCNPDPLKRGHAKNRSGMTSRYALDRYISFFNRLAEAAEHKLSVKVQTIAVN